jgi:hypothetical protein
MFEQVSNLQVVYFNNTYYVNLQQGLSLLQKNSEWLNTLKLCSSRLKRLKQKGFSGQVVLITADEISSTQEMISYQDWLALVSYVAANNGHLAIKILSCYAKSGFSPFHQLLDERRCAA